MSEHPNITEARAIVVAASQLAWSLYASGDLSADQHGPISLAISVAEAGIKNVQELTDRLHAAEALISTLRECLAGEVSTSAVRVALGKYDAASGGGADGS